MSDNSGVKRGRWDKPENEGEKNSKVRITSHPPFNSQTKSVSIATQPEHTLITKRVAGSLQDIKRQKQG